MQQTGLPSRLWDKLLEDNPAARVVLHGFSDGKGKPEYNLKLSRKRAEAVAQFLVTSYGDSCRPNRDCGSWRVSGHVGGRRTGTGKIGPQSGNRDHAVAGVQSEPVIEAVISV